LIENLQLRPMRAEDRAAVLALRVTDAQQPFVEPIAETLSFKEAARENHVIEVDDVVAGFFQIETVNLRRFQNASAHELELHEFFIDIGMQSKGIGSFFVLNLNNYIRDHSPNWSTISLSVNCKNLTAYRLYQKGGFVDTGEIWLEGRSGPQHVMRMQLRAELQ
jgi:ribosomal protein S18 acetylase RimI-like enzyme